MTTGLMLALGSLTTEWTVIETAKLTSAVTVLLVLLAMRRWIRSAYAVPIAIVVMWVLGVIVLQSTGLSAPKYGWYLPSTKSAAMYERPQTATNGSGFQAMANTSHI